MLMARFRVPDRCTGLNMQDGREYKRNARGYVEVRDPDHVAAIRRSWPAQHGLIHEVEEVPGFRTNDPPNDCPTCGFSAWSWQRRCPRCGGDLSRDTRSLDGEEAS